MTAFWTATRGRRFEFRTGHERSLWRHSKCCCRRRGDYHVTLPTSLSLEGAPHQKMVLPSGSDRSNARARSDGINYFRPHGKGTLKPSWSWKAEDEIEEVCLVLGALQIHINAAIAVYKSKARMSQYHTLFFPSIVLPPSAIRLHIIQVTQTT